MNKDKAFEQQFISMEPFIRSLVRRRFRSPDDIDDIVQDVLIRVWKQRHTKIGCLNAWLTTVTRSAIIDFYRKTESYKAAQKRCFEYATLEYYDPEPALFNPALWRRVDNLSEPILTTLMLRSEGLSKARAIATDTNIGTVRSRIYHGRRQLKALLESQ